MNSNLLENFITNINKVVELVPSQLIAIKNLQYKYVYASPAYASLVGISQDKLIGKTCRELDLKPIIETDMDQTEDEQVILNSTVKSFIRIHNLTTGIQPRTFIKSPIVNNGNVIGIIAQCFEFGEITNSNMFNPKNYSIYDKSLIQLTRREKQIIFLFLNQNNSQKIANILSKMENKTISKSTIDSIFKNQLYSKFNVYNRDALYQKLIDLGFEKLIPKEILIAASFSLQKQYIY